MRARLAPNFGSYILATITELIARSMSQAEHAVAGLGDEDLEAQLAELEQVLLVHTQYAELKDLQ